MAEEVRASINVEVDATSAIAQLRQLQSTISSVNKSLVAGDKEAIKSQQLWRESLVSNIQQGKAFSASIQNVESSVVRLSRSIEKNQLSVGQSFGLWRQSLAKYRAEQGAVNDLQRVAEQRARNLQTQYIALGDSVNGVSKAVAMRPLGIFNADLAVNAQRMQLMGRVLDQGSTALVNWGKNTQWAGRQLMVGLGVPITIFGASAAKVFTDLEKSTIAFKRVYGDLGVSEQEKNAALAGIQELAAEFTKYGIAVTDTVNLSAKAAAAGFQGEDLVAQTTEATRLATLGQIDYQQALEATITLNSAFGVGSEELAQKIDFLNAAENQTVLSLDDISRAIPRVGPVVRQLGGDVEDLAVLMTALREGGVSAEQGANAIKSGLAALINPTNRAVEVLKGYGINIKAIVKQNEGELLPTVQAAASAFDTLSGPDRQRALETLFGKFQYSRLGALFDNINKDGSQAARTMELMGYSTEQLAEIAEGELATVEQAISVKFTAALEKAKLAIAPIGEQFLKIATPIIDVGTRILDKFQELPDGIKTFATIAVAAIGLVIPTVIMLTGLFANLFGTGFKLATNFLRVIGVLPKAIDFQTEAEQRAVAATESLESASGRAATAALKQSQAVDSLNRSLNDYIILAGRASGANFVGGKNPAVGAAEPQRTRFARGGVVGGSGNKDTEPALLTPGEFVVNAKAAKKFRPILAAMNEGSIAGYNAGTRVKGAVNVGGETLSLVATKANADALQRMVDRLLDNNYQVSEVLEILTRNLSEDTRDLGIVTDAFITEIKSSVGALASYSMKKIEGSHIGGESREISGVQQVLSALSGAAATPAQGAKRASFEELAGMGAISSASLLGGAKLGLPELFNQMMKSTGGGVLGSEISQYFKNALGDEKALRSIFAPLGRSGEAIPLEQRKAIVASLAEDFERAGDVVFKDTADLGAGIKSFSSIIDQGARSGNEGLVALSSALDDASSSLRYLRVTIDEGVVKAAVAAGSITQARADELLGTFRSGRGGTATVQVASIGAIDLEQAKMGAEKTAKASIEALEDATGSNSDSREGQRVAQDVVNGYSNQLKRGTKQAYAAGEALGEAGIGGLAATSNIDEILKQRLGVGRLVEAEKVEQQKILELQKAQNRELQKRAQLIARQKGVGPDAARRLAAEQMAQEAAAAGRPQRPQLTPQLIDEAYKTNEEIDQLREASGDLRESFDGLGEETDKSKDEQKKTGSKLKKFGAKAQGAFFALDGLVFGLSMLDNNIGQMAQTILPAIFGIQAFTGMFSLISGPISAFIAAVAIVPISLYFLKSKVDSSAREVAKTTEAISGVGSSLSGLAKQFGGIDPREQWNSFMQGISSKTEKEILSQGQEFVKNTEEGQKLLNEMKLLSGQERIKSLELKIKTALAFGKIKKKDADAIVAGLAEELNDPILGKAVSQGISSGLDREQLKQELTSIYVDAANSAISNAPEPFDIYGDFELPSREDFESGFTLDDEQAALSQLVSVQEQLSIARSTIKNELRTATGDARETLKEQLKDLSDKSIEVDKAITDLYNSLSSNAAFVTGPSVDAAFSGLLKNLAEAKGISDETFSSMEQNARDFEEVLSKSGKVEEYFEEASRSFQTQVLSGQIDATTQIGAGYQELIDAGQEYRTILENTDASSLVEVMRTLTNIRMLDPEKESLALSKISESLQIGVPSHLATGIRSVDSALVDFNINSSFFTDNAETNSAAFSMLTNSINGFDLQKMAELNELYNSLSDQVGGDFGAVGEDLIRGLDSFNKKIKSKFPDGKIKLNAEISTKQWNKSLEELNVSYEQFNKLPDLTKMAILYKLDVIAEIDLKIESVSSSTTFGSGDVQALADLGDKRNDALKAVEDMFNFDFGKGGEKDKSGGGASKEKTYLETLTEQLNSNAKLYLDAQGGFEKYFKARGKFLGAFNKLRGLGFSESAIAALGTGAEAVKKAAELLGLDQKARKELISKMEAEQVGTTMEGIRSARATSQQKAVGARALGRFGAEEEVTKAIMDDEETLLSFAVANKKEREAIVRAKRREIAAEKELKALQDPKASQIEAINKQVKLETIAFDRSMKQMDKEIEKKQEVIDLIQDEIDSIEELNAADELLIRDKDRQIEAYNRQIDGIERLIEKEQDSIDKLKEEDDLRNRRSSALSHDLEMLSQAEEDIRNAYQQRIDALEQVATINDRILQQQRDQLNISQALASGDIYEATQAAREMQQNDVAFAQTQAREALTTGMENEIAGLRTAGGLTREEAEKEIANIKEQSYQTSLLIQGIEDNIAKKNKDIEAVKISIRNVEDEKLKIQDRIFDRETLILSIQKQRLDPAQKEYNTLVDKRDEMKKIFDTRIEDLKLQVESLELTNDEINQVNNLGDSWIRVGEAIAAANKARKQGLEKLGSVPTRIAGESYDKWQARITAWQDSRGALEATYDSSVSSAIATGNAASGAFAGGLMKYAGGGSVIGSGARDSISAMLSPGEFVIRKAMVDKYGIPMFESLNQGSFSMPRYNTQTSTAGNVKVNNQNTSNIVAPMYNNYSVNVSVSNTNASADEIANRTMMKIRQMQDMQIRGGRGY